MPIRARAIVTATGPWAQGIPPSGVKLRLTKGCHLVVEHRRLPVSDAVVMSEQKRILFALPWGERTIVGTTDTDFEGPPEDVRVELDELKQLCSVANRFFPSANLRESDMVSGWAGLRPLLADRRGQPSDISRSHHIGNPEPGWWDVAGGKLTTYRLMAEETVDRIVKWINKLNGSAGSFRPCRTAEETLLPAEDLCGISGILPPEFREEVIEHYVRNEWAMNLDDIMVRRTSWHYYLTDAASRARIVAESMSQLLGWSKQTKARELENYERLQRHGFRESEHLTS